MMDELAEKLKKTDKIVVGLSGGADSVALTHILFTSYGAKKLVAAHINHGIRGEEGERDEGFVRDFCHSLGLELKLLRADVPAIAAKERIGLEECGRRLRYEFFEKLCTENSLIATAHNMNDNAETLMLNLIRGTGLSGLAGIPPMRGNIVRPILNMSRREIEAYCQNNGLLYVNDSTNDMQDYTRNKLRHSVMPILQQINPQALEHICAAAAIAGQGAKYAEKRAAQLLHSCAEGRSLKAEALLEEEEYIASETLRMYLKQRGASPENKHIRAAMDVIRYGGGLSLPGGVYLQTAQGLITADSMGEIPGEQPIIPGKPTEYGGKIIALSRKNSVQMTKVNNLLFKNAVDCAKIKNDLTVGPRREGENFAPAGRGVRKSLKKLFQEKKIPSMYRDLIAVIRDGERIVFVEGFGVSQEYSITADTQAYLEVKIIPGDEYDGKYDK